MEFNRDARGSNRLNSKESGCGQGQNRTADTRIFSPLTVPGLCDTIGRYLYLFNSLTPVFLPLFFFPIRTHRYI